MLLTPNCALSCLLFSLPFQERALVFEHRETKEQPATQGRLSAASAGGGSMTSLDRFSFPQHNGDVFAFTDSVNRQFVHGVPREPLGQKGPRILT